MAANLATPLTTTPIPMHIHSFDGSLCTMPTFSMQAGWCLLLYISNFSIVSATKTFNCNVGNTCFRVAVAGMSLVILHYSLMNVKSIQATLPT